MPQGDKSSYTEKQKRQAAHIGAGQEKKGICEKPQKRGLGPPLTSSSATAKSAAPAERVMNQNNLHL